VIFVVDSVRTLVNRGNAPVLNRGKTTKTNEPMFKSIGIAGAFGAFGLPLLAVVAGAVVLVGVGAAVGYAVAGTKAAAAVAGTIAAL
jgi:hypothetical protein